MKHGMARCAVFSVSLLAAAALRAGETIEIGIDRMKFVGESWSRRFDRPGSYPYTCGPHPEMKGLVEVVP